MARTRVYRHGALVDEGFPVSKVSDYLAEPDAVVWFDLCEPTAVDLGSISEELGLHPLAVEDAVAEHQRAKLDRYQYHDPGDAPDRARQPAERDHEAGDQLGRDHRGADRGDRILRTECAVSRFRAYFGFLGFYLHHDRAVRGAVCRVPPPGLALSGRRAAGQNSQRQDGTG
jgi:hypothetical protein